MIDALVIGGGIVGMSAAYHLVTNGANTLLIDRADVGQATAAGAGIISPETSAIESEAWLDLAYAAADYYPILVQQLRDEGAGDPGYAPMQELVVAVGEDEDAPFFVKHRHIRERQAKRGRPAREDLAELDSRAAQEMMPLLAPVRHALLFRRAARVDGRLLNAALRRAALQRGLMLRSANVEQLVVSSGAVTGVSIGSETMQAGAVVLAGGAWSSVWSQALGIQLPVTPQRGQIIHLRLPAFDTAQLPIVSAFRGHYMVPWDDHRMVVGATREFVGFQPHTTAAGIREVLGEALRVAPGLDGAEVADIRVGLRPATSDSLPVLGPVPNVRNLYLAAGHGATGLTVGPYSGKVIADLILDKPPQVDLTAFSVTRFDSLSLARRGLG